MNDNKDEPLRQDEVMRMVADVVSAYVRHNPVPATEIPELIRIVHRSLLGVQAQAPAPEVAAAKPAVAPRRSIHDDYIVCLEDGKKLKMLKRYLRTKFNMSPDEYRNKWSLPPDYPMVAPNYSKQRSKFAKNIGLGRRREAG